MFNKLKKMKLKWILLMMGAFIFGWMLQWEVQAQETTASEDNVIEEIELFAKALGVIKEAYPDDVNQRTLLYEAVKGMLDGLDTYSEFIEPHRYELLKIHMRGEYVGIGILLNEKEGRVAIKSVKPGSAAYKAGLAAEDFILKVNGKKIQGMSLEDVSHLLRGDENTALVMTIKRLGLPQAFDVEIIREHIQIEAVQDVRIIEKSIGYFRLNSWQDNTMEQVDHSLNELIAQGMKALIIDLRNNDGGLLPQAVELAERFLPAGKRIVTVQSRIEEQRNEYISSGDKQVEDYPLILLVNEESASASEIFSAAMQDHRRGTLLGTKTYGKASVQSVIPLDDQSAMKLTTARYISPLGRDINQVGIEPDEVIIQDDPGVPDKVVLRALEILKNYR